MAVFLYLGIPIVAVALAVATILRLCAASINGWLVLPAFSTLFMIKLRCVTGPYPCGFMSFTGGFTWHWLGGASLFLGGWGLGGLLLTAVHSTAWQAWMEKLGRGMTPLLGLWLAVVWETLPVQAIHPPSHRGSCPNLRVICHDLPLLGFGGLVYWSIPFVLWAAVTVGKDLGDVFREDR